MLSGSVLSASGWEGVMIVYCCPACGRRMELRDELAGKLIRCPECHSPERVRSGDDGEDVEVLEEDRTGSGYRCLHCKSRRPPLFKRVRTPLGSLLGVVVGGFGLFLLLVLIGVLALASDLPIGLLLLILLGAVGLWLGAVVWIETVLKESRRVCPDCKARVS